MRIKNNKVITALLLLFFVCMIGNAQSIKSTSGFSLNDFEKLPAAGTSALTDVTQKELFPVGNVIHSESYYVGPNDVLSIQILPLEPIATPTIVTAENTIVSQRLGEICVNNLTLQQVRDTLNYLIKKKNPSATVSISLIKPRTVFVSIRGNVIAPTTYTLPASYTVSTAIQIANQIQATTVTSQDEQSAILRLQEAQKERERTFSETGVSINSNYFSRNIRVRRASGVSIVADIERANATKDSKYDPFIREGDEIFVPFDAIDYPTISIVGEVLRPISVVYKKGDKASHLLKMGYGFTENADLDAVYLHTSTSSSPIKLSVDSTAELLSQEIDLSPGCVIIVGVQKHDNYINIGTVSVKGEVKTPGVYTIERGETRLRDIISKAGGFTNKAYLPRSYIGRRDNQQNERVAPKRLYMEYFQFSDLTMEDTSRFMMDIDLRRPVVSCDIDAAFNNNSEINNIILQDGDVVFISNNTGKVTVFGQVVTPGIVDYSPGKSMEWYINQAGGYATGAAKNRARIIRNNRVWENGFEENIMVNDGDEIYVPRPPDIPPGMELQKWAAIAGLAMTAVTFIQFIYNVFKK